MTITGFKSTDIESRSKVEPATVTNFGYKRQGLDTNALVGVFSLGSVTCSGGTSSSIAVMSPGFPVRAGDILDFDGIRSEITAVSGTSHTLGRSISALTNGSSVIIFRPSYLLLSSSGATSFNLAEYGGVATTLGQKTEAASIPVVLSSTQSVDTGALAALDAVLDCSTTPRYLVVEMWGTFTGTVTFESFLDTPSGTAVKPEIGSISTQFGVSSASSTSIGGANLEIIAHFSPFAAQKFRVRVSAYTSGTLKVRITNLNNSVDAKQWGLTTIANTYLEVIRGPVEIDAVNSNYLTVIGGNDYSLDPTGNGVRRFPLYSGAVVADTALAVGVKQATAAAVLPARGKIAGTALTLSYANLLVMGGAGKMLQIFNSTEVPVEFSYDGGTTTHLELGPYESLAEDFAANNMTLTSGTIQARLVSGAAPLNGGSVRAKVVR